MTNLAAGVRRRPAHNTLDGTVALRLTAYDLAQRPPSQSLHLSPARLSPSSTRRWDDETGRPKGILGNEELMTVIGNFPISILAAFPGLGLSHAVVHTLIDQVSARDE